MNKPFNSVSAGSINDIFDVVYAFMVEHMGNLNAVEEELAALVMECNQAANQRMALLSPLVG